MAKKMLVTSALPYANGSIHIGHLVEYIQTDIFVRALKLFGEDVIYCCADDAHGTPIEINAAKQGVKPQDFIKKWFKEHQEDFKSFLIHFDSYHSTHSQENKYFTELIFNKLKDKGYIYTKEIQAMYSEKGKRFLPDRFIKGECPKCSAKDQYGDVCEACGATYQPTELKNPYSILDGDTPVLKPTKHYYFKLSAFAGKLKEYIEKNGRLQQEVKNHVLKWIEEGLKDWDISRDAPYFGFTIPTETDKYFYVWLDAPIGYIASAQKYCQENNLELDDYWKNGRIIHFIGKDIMYFHLLFWPAVLMGSGFALPENVIVHGFLTVNGEKMSKSRGTFLTAKDFLKISQAEFLRYFYASHLGKNTSDVDLDLREFRDKINTELVSNIANFCYRSLSFINKNFEGKIGTPQKNPITDEMQKEFQNIKHLYEQAELRAVLQRILHVGDLANQYFQKSEPWKLIKEDKEKAHEVLSLSANFVANLCILLKPILPEFCKKIEAQLNVTGLSWKDLGFNLKDHEIGKSEIIYTKIENQLQIDIRSKEEPYPDLTVGTVLEVKEHPEADKLYVLQVDLGDEKRQLVAGLREHLKPEEIQGKNIIVVTNLKPARLRGIESRGMLLAAQGEGTLELISPSKSKPGEKVNAQHVKKPGRQITIEEFAKFKITVQKGRVTLNGDELHSKSEPIMAQKAPDGAKVR